MSCSSPQQHHSPGLDHAPTGGGLPALNHTPPLDSVLLSDSSMGEAGGMAVGVACGWDLLAVLEVGVAGGRGLMTWEREAHTPESCGEEGDRPGDIGTLVLAVTVEMVEDGV